MPKVYRERSPLHYFDRLERGPLLAVAGPRRRGRPALRRPRRWSRCSSARGSPTSTSRSRARATASEEGEHPPHARGDTRVRRQRLRVRTEDVAPANAPRHDGQPACREGRRTPIASTRTRRTRSGARSRRSRCRLAGRGRPAHKASSHPRSAADRAGPDGGQHRRLRVPEPGQAGHR